MGHTLLCVLGLFLLNTLLYGHAEGQDDDQEKSADDSVGTGPTGAVAILEVPDFTLFGGDSVTLRCRHRTPENEMKASFIKDGSPLKMETNHPSLSLVEVTINPVSVSDGGTYTCKFDDGAESEERELKVEARRREVTLTAGNTIIPAGGSVTLSCSVEKPAGFRYLWYRLTSDSTEVNESDRVISHGGKYTCRGWRSEDGVFTPESDAVTIQETVSNKVSVILQPNWPQIFSGETITLRCEIQAGGDTKWTYEWTPAKLNRPPTDNEYRISSATVSHSGDYSCKGRRDSYSSTEWSDVIKLTVSSQRPKAQLRADRRTIPAGGSVTLSCSVNPSSGWKYFWYRGEKTSEPLNTQDAVFISDGQISVSQGGLYWCRGGRGDPVYYTKYSDPVSINKMNRPQPVLTVSPSWLSPGASVTLSCRVKDPSAGWRFFWFKAVPKLSDYSYDQELLPGSSNGTEQDSYIVHGQTHTAGYKCRAGRGDPVNYTYYSEPKFVWSGDFHSSASLTVSPDRVQHFTSDSVSLSCEGNSTEWRVRRFTEDDYQSYSSYCSYWGTMTGSTCSINSYWQSDAVYWCESGSGEFSNTVNITIQMSRPESSSVPVPLIVGLVCGIVLILLLLLLYRYRPSKDSCSIRPIQSESTNRGSAENYSSPVHVSAGDAPLYETIKGFENTQSVADESQDLTYSLIELKNVRKKKKRHEPDEVCVYSEVNAGTADDSLMYAQFNRRNKGKAKKNKGKSPPAAADETVYSEVKPGTALGL